MYDLPAFVGSPTSLPVVACYQVPVGYTAWVAMVPNSTYPFQCSLSAQNSNANALRVQLGSPVEGIPIMLIVIY